VAQVIDTLMYAALMYAARGHQSLHKYKSTTNYKGKGRTGRGVCAVFIKGPSRLGVHATTVVSIFVLLGANMLHGRRNGDVGVS
jgi:hypothetical protein